MKGSSATEFCSVTHCSSLEASEYDFVHTGATTCNERDLYTSNDVGNCLEANGIRMPLLHRTKDIDLKQIVQIQRFRDSDLLRKSTV